MSAPVRVVIATDSFKGTMTALEASTAIAHGWSRVRPHDRVEVLPQADGGEGTLAAMLAAQPGAVMRSAGLVTGPDGAPTPGEWLSLPNGTAVVELAQASGITLMPVLDPHRATTRGFGEVIAAAIASGAGRVELCLGGSASSDGGAGALSALGARLLDERGAPIPDGAAGLDLLARVDLADVLPAPPGGVGVLTDVTSPLLGPDGAVAVFGAQKGVRDDERDRFEQRLRRLARVLATDPALPGMGAAGGTTFGLSGIWQLDIASGASRIAELTGLARAAWDADVIVTGEGRFDAQSLAGKVVGTVIELARGRGAAVAIIAGTASDVGLDAGLRPVELATLAGDGGAAMADAPRWARVAGEHLATMHHPLGHAPSRLPSTNDPI